MSAMDDERWSGRDVADLAPQIPGLGARRTVEELAHDVGTYGAAVGLAMVRHPRHLQLRSTDALVLFAMGFHADMALRSGDGYGGVLVAELVTLIPTMAASTVRVAMGNLVRWGFAEERPGRAGTLRYRIHHHITDPFDVGPAAPAAVAGMARGTAVALVRAVDAEGHPDGNNETGTCPPGCLACATLRQVPDELVNEARNYRLPTTP